MAAPDAFLFVQTDRLSYPTDFLTGAAPAGVAAGELPHNQSLPPALQIPLCAENLLDGIALSMRSKRKPFLPAQVRFV